MTYQVFISFFEVQIYDPEGLQAEHHTHMGKKSATVPKMRSNAKYPDT